MESGVKAYEKREVVGILLGGVRKKANLTVAIQSRGVPNDTFHKSKENDPLNPCQYIVRQQSAPSDYDDHHQS